MKKISRKNYIMAAARTVPIVLYCIAFLNSESAVKAFLCMGLAYIAMCSAEWLDENLF